MVRKAASGNASSPSSTRKKSVRATASKKKPGTIPAFIAARVKADAIAPAILAPGLAPLTYEMLEQQVRETAAALQQFGIARRGRVVIVVRPGPNAATAFLGVAAAAAATPLNPDYLAAELDSYFELLEPRALVTESGFDQAIETATRRKIPVILVEPSGETGRFTLRMPDERTPSRPEKRVTSETTAKPTDIALVLFTSGTTGKPKMVPLSHGNLLASAHAVAETLALTPSDRSLAVMPLFHIHGLVAALLAPLYSGGSVVCPPGFHAIDFFGWLTVFRPTWFSAVPSMHRALLARADSQQKAIKSAKLRFLRSSSSPLAPTVLAELERAFGAPVIEAYGMSEAAHQMASNPLPPLRRMAGSVGLAAGPEIAVIDAEGREVPAGTTGEVAIRGPNVMKGYVNNAAANREAFAKGWFRTGDLGVIDRDGYLTLIGRIKEFINRGGEKIGPREVEEVLLAHDAVFEAAAFPVPDPALGEEVGAAVVLKPGAKASLAELKEFAAKRLAHFKLPRHLAIVPAIPKGATGKIQRAKLAKQLGLDAPRPPANRVDSTPPRNPLESRLCALWCQVLRVDEVGIGMPFLALGGDSILAAQLVARMNAEFGLALRMADIWDTPTVADMALVVARKASQGKAAKEPIPRLGSSSPPLSFAQEWWLSLEAKTPPAAASNRICALVLQGPINLSAFGRALTALVRRQDALRMAFPMENGVRVVRIDKLPAIALPARDLSAVPADRIWALAARQVTALASQPFDLEKRPLWRAEFLKVTSAAHVFALIVHHAIFDGWSMAVLIRELATLYEGFAKGKQSSLPALPASYGDIAAWQRSRLTGKRLADLDAFWRKKLSATSEPAKLPFAKARPPVPSLRGGLAQRILPLALAEALRTLGRNNGATLYMILLAVFHAQLARYSGGTDVLTGCLTAGRGRTEAEFLIGLFFNVLPLRSDLSGDPTVRELILRTKAMAQESFVHQDMPIVGLQSFVPPPAAGDSPISLVPILFQLRNFPAAIAEAAGLRFSEFKVASNFARFDLTFDITGVEEGLRCDLAFNADIFDAATARTILADFEEMCAAFAALPEKRFSDLPAMRAAKRS